MPVPNMEEWQLLTDLMMPTLAFIFLWLLYQFKHGWRYGMRIFLQKTSIIGMCGGFFSIFYIIVNTMMQPGMRTMTYVNLFGEAWWELGMMIICTPGVVWRTRKMIRED